MNKLSLLKGKSLKLLDSLNVKHPILNDIEELGYDEYNQYINILCVNPYDIGDILWFDLNIWYEDVNAWKFFIGMYPNDEKCQKALKWFTDKDFALADDGKEIYLYDVDTNIILNEHVFMVMSDWIKEINFISSKTQYNPGNKRTKIYLLEQQRKKRQRNDKSKIDLISIISSVAWKSGIGMDKIWNLPIYQIYDAYFRLNCIDNYDKTMVALYSGNIDTSKTKVDLEKINWSNIITI